jgi:hypothetical protein
VELDGDRDGELLGLWDGLSLAELLLLADDEGLRLGD